MEKRLADFVSKNYETLQLQDGTNRAATSASSKNFSIGTGWSSNGGENDDRRS
jgi:hypothetical protein